MARDCSIIPNYFSEGAVLEPTCSCHCSSSRYLDPCLHMSQLNEVLPIELLHIILCQDIEDESVPVCIQVCQLWREIINSPTRQQQERRKVPTKRQYVEAVAALGYVSVIQWAIEMMNCPKQRLANGAARGGQVETLQVCSRQHRNYLYLFLTYIKIITTHN